MASLNSISLIGNAGRDAELRYLANGTAQVSFSMAVNRSTRGADGEWKNETDWFNIIAWRDLAERISPQIAKGKQVYVEGRMSMRSWQGDDGVKHERWEIHANKVLLLGSRDEESGVSNWNSGRAAPRTAPIEDDDDSLPFE